MKKIISFLLILCMLSGLIAFTVSAEEENFIPEADSTFESGNYTWNALAGGMIKTTKNPTGEGKVLCYSNIPDKSYASPQIDVRNYILNNVAEPKTVYVSMDIYTKTDDILGVIVRVRTKTVEGYSMCTTDGTAFCVIGKVDVYAGEWNRITIPMEITEADLSSSEPWNICFDGLSRSTRDTIYIDNFYVGLEEENPLEEPDDIGETQSSGGAGEKAVNFLSVGNSTFEADKTSWGVLSKGAVNIVDNPNGEGKVLCYSDLDPDVSYATPILDIRGAIQKNVDEEITIYGAMDIYCEKDMPGSLIRLRTTTPEGFSLCAADDVPYCSFGMASASAGEWCTINFTFEIFEEDLQSKEPWHLCFDNISRNLTAEDKIYIDNVYIGIEEPQQAGVEEKPVPEKTPVSRLENTLIGTIRWDAFVKSTPDGTDPASQVARVLSPAKYHGQAPFFSVVNEDGTISFPEYTVETWEKEAEYAVAGGLDYFAYLWYESTDAMSQPRKLHLQSEKKDIIKYCGILESIRSKKSMDELFTAMKDSCYLTVDGRPVLFLYGVGDGDNWTEKSVKKLRQDAANAGIEKSLYLVGMCFTDKYGTFSNVVTKDIDAVSWYAVNAKKTAEPFAELAANTEAGMKKMGDYSVAFEVDIIPSFTTGRDTRARIETGVSWVDGDPNATEDKDKPYRNLYTLAPTMKELEDHIVNVLAYTATTTKAAKTNIVCSYGWNEHEEGGWLCPTIAVDENGNPIYNDDGTIKVNTERLDALKRAKERVLNGEGIVAVNPEATDEVQGEGGNNNNKTTINPLYIAIPAVAVIIIIGAVVAVVVAKKKKTEK